MLHHAIGRAGGIGDGVDVAILFDGEAFHRFAGLRDAFNNAPGPARFNANHHHASDIRVGPRADKRAEMQIKIGAELQAAIGVRNRERALDIIGNSFAGRVGKIVHRQDDDMVAHTHAAIFAAPAFEGGAFQINAHGAYHRFVLTLWT